MAEPVEEKPQIGVSEAVRSLKKRVTKIVHPLLHPEQVQIDSVFCQMEEASRRETIQPQLFGGSLNKFVMKHQLFSRCQMHHWVIQRNLDIRRESTSDICEEIVPSKLMCKALDDGSEKDSIILYNKVESLERFGNLLAQISSPVIDEQVSAARELRSRTVDSTDFCGYFAKMPQAVSTLLYPLRHNIGGHPLMEQDVIGTIIHISKHTESSELLDKVPELVEMLVKCMAIYVSVRTRAVAAQALCELAKRGDVAKIAIGRSDAIASLGSLLRYGHTYDNKYASAALLELWSLEENQPEVISCLNKECAGVFVCGLQTLTEEGLLTIKDMSKKGALPLLESLTNTLFGDNEMFICMGLALQIQCIRD